MLCTLFFRLMTECVHREGSIHCQKGDNGLACLMGTTRTTPYTMWNGTVPPWEVAVLCLLTGLVDLLFQNWN